LLAEEIKLDDLMWTRDENHVYYLARVVRPWSYIGKRENLDADVINTVGVRMIRVGVESHVPGKIIAAFRAGRTLQRVIDPTIAAFSKHVFNQLARSSIYSAKPFRLDIFSLLSADDCEDLVYVYLQTRGYIVFPSRRQRDTQSYEYVLVHRKTGREAIAQVKTGKDVIPIDNASWPQPVDRVYAFSPNEMYKGRRSKKVHLLRRRQMLEFMKGNRSLLPPAIGTWMDIAANGSGRIDH